MPIIPFEPARTVRPSGATGAFERAESSPEAFGAGVARATGGLGQALEKTGDVAANAAVNFQNLQNEATVNDTYSSKFSPQFRDMYQKYYALQGKDAVDQMPTFMQNMEELRGQAREGLQNDAQRRMFDQVSRRRVEMELDGMARYADQQNKVWRSTTHTATLQTLADQAADKWNDEQSFGSALGSGIAEIDRYYPSIGASAEVTRAAANKFISSAAVNRVERWALVDPKGASDWYKANQSMVDAQAKPAVESRLKSALQPVEAREVADDALRSIMQHTTLTGVGGGEYNGQAMLGMKGDPDEIARQVVAATNLSEGDRAGILDQIARQKATAGGVAATVSTKQEVMAKIGDGLARVQELAEKKHPGDPVFADLATTQFMGHLNKVAAAVNGLSTQAHATVMERAAGLDGKPAPLTPQELLSDPTVAKAWPLLSPEAQRGFVSANGVLAQNARAANGELTRSNPATVLDLRQRIYLPDGDPNKLTSTTQLTPYLTLVNHTDFERLRKEMAEANTPEGNPFLKQVNGIKQTAQKMLTGSMSQIAIAHPELAQEAAYRFDLDVDAQIKAMRAAGKTPAEMQELFTPGSKSYVLDPNRVARFMPTDQDVAAYKAAKLKPAPAVAPANVPQRLPGETPGAYLKRIGKG